MSEWQRVRLGDCADFQEGYVNPPQGTSRYFDGPVKWLRAVDLNDGFVWETSRTLSTEGFESAGRSAKLFAPDTIAISKSGTIGRVGILKDYMCGNRAVINIVPRADRCLARTIFYALRLGRREIEILAEGSVQKNLYVSALSQFMFALPPIVEQQQICDLLGGLDDKIELNRRMNETLEAMAQAIFRDWFVDFGPVRRKIAGATDPVEIMGGLVADPVRAAELARSQSASLDGEDRPVGWAVRPLSELTTELRRGIGPKYVEQGGVLVLNQKCIRNRQVSFGPARRHDAAGKTVTGRTLINGDVLVNSTGVGTLGRVAQIWGLDQRVIVDSHVTVVRASADFSSIYLGLALGLREEEIVALGEGSTGQTELSREQLGRMEMVVPSKTVLDQFDAICSPLIERIQANRLEAATLAETRDYLLPRLMSGEVRVRDVAQEIAA